ncbi:MAG: carboxypeptidase-like regulatory domain-containing protein [Planctomycetota bacterium]
MSPSPASPLRRWAWLSLPAVLALLFVVVVWLPREARSAEQPAAVPAPVGGAAGTDRLADGLAGGNPGARPAERVLHGAFPSAPPAAPATHVRGTVRGAGGLALEGARCELNPGTTGAGFGDVGAGQAPRTGTSGGDGRFELAAGPGPWRLSVAAEGYARWTADHLWSGDELDVLLVPAVGLGVRVRDEQGLAVEGVRLRVTRSFRDLAALPLAEATSDAAGHALLAGLAPGEQYVCARHPDFEVHFASFKLPPSGAAEIELTLRRGVRLAGAVRAATGPALTGARVRVEAFSKGQSLVIELDCDADGGFTTEACFGQGEALTVTAVAPNFAETSLRLRIDAEPGGEQQVELELTSSGYTAVGRAVDASGAAVPGAAVRLTAIGRVARGMDGLTGALAEVTPHAERWRRSDVTDADGRFRLEGLAAEREYVVLLSERGAAPRVAWVPPAEPGAAVDLGDLQLTRAGSLSGTVRDAAGKPRAGELVRATFETVLTADEYELDLWRPTRWWRPLRTHSGPDGGFRFDGLAPGSYEVEVGGAPAGSWYVAAGADPGPLDLQVPEGSDATQHTIEGRVSTAEGAPVPKALVALFAPGQLAGAGAEDPEPEAMTFTDYRGGFRLRAPEGEYDLRATDLRGVFIEHLQPLPLDGATEFLELTLSPDTRPVEPLIARVVGPDGLPLAGVDVSLIPPENDYCGCIAFLARTDEHGQVLFEQLSARDHELVASDPSGRYSPARHAPARAGDFVELVLGF